MPPKTNDDRRLCQRCSKRSVSAQVIQLLDQALQMEETRRSQARVLAGIRRRRVAYAKKPSTPDSVTLLREDRER